MTERQRIEHKLDTVIREIVRFRDSECITCGSKSNLTVGHFIKRRHTITRWDLMNVHGQCWECNSRDNQQEYHDAMLKLYPETAVKQLIDTSRLDIRFTNYELKEIYDKLIDYKNKFKDEADKKEKL